MHKRLNQIWNSLGFSVVDSLGANRRIIDGKGKTVCSGGYQEEMQYIQFNHPEGFCNA